MKIQKIKIHNWRSIKDLEIDFQDMMIFIGQNNHGKSNVLSALLFFFGVIDCAESDFNIGADDLYVETTFFDLDDYDKDQFSKYLTTDNKITVRKQAQRGKTFEYHGYYQIPDDEWLREENVGNYLTRLLISPTPLASLVPSTGKLTKEIVKEAQKSYIISNSGAVTYTYALEVTNFLDIRTIEQGKFGNVYLIPSVKNASEEFKKGSIFGKLLTDVINEISSNNESFKEAKKIINDLAQVLDKRVADGSLNASRPQEISKLEQMLEAELEKSWDTTIDIEIIPPNVDEALRLGTRVLVNDPTPTGIDRKGHGLQRLLIFALIKVWAKISRQRNEAEEETTRRASKSTYFIFEEPELYLHPQAQRELFENLKELSSVNNQIFISTHSSSFIDLDMYKSICIVYKKDPAEGTKHLQCATDLFAEADEKKRFNMTYWINPDRGELFFAKRVILLEGPTDKTVVHYLAKKLDIFKYDHTLIDCGGKGNIPIYLQLLNKFKLSYVAVYDMDHQTNKLPADIALADKSSKRIEEQVDPALGTSIILNNNIEEEIGITDESNKNKPYFALERISDSSFLISAPLEDKVKRMFQ